MILQSLLNSHWSAWDNKPRFSDFRYAARGKGLAGIGKVTGQTNQFFENCRIKQVKNEPPNKRIYGFASKTEQKSVFRAKFLEGSTPVPSWNSLMSLILWANKTGCVTTLTWELQEFLFHKAALATSGRVFMSSHLMHVKTEAMSWQKAGLWVSNSLFFWYQEMKTMQ